MSRTAIALLLASALTASTSPEGAAGSGGPTGPRPPNVVLRTQENKTVRFYDDLVRGKVVLISFMFTSCQGVCPRTVSNLVKVQRALGDRLGRDVFMYSITLDPKTDTPKVLKQYARSVGAKPGWLFLTGQAADIELLRRKLGVYDPNPEVDADRTQHGAIIVYGNDAKGRWSALPSLFESGRIANAVLGTMR